MHPNPAFCTQRPEVNLALARDRGFGVLAVNGRDGPLLSHIPFLLSSAGEWADLHLVRSNPIARLDHPIQAVITVSGPDGYVSPDWYGIADQVPTWNYVAVHLRGTLLALSQEDMRDMLDRQTAAYENRLSPKLPWTTAKMTPTVLDKMMRQIRPFRLEISDVSGTWKLNQNKPDIARQAAARQIAGGIGAELGSLAALTVNPPLKS